MDIGESLRYSLNQLEKVFYDDIYKYIFEKVKLKAKHSTNGRSIKGIKERLTGKEGSELGSSDITKYC
jgi:hypothetical protein